MQTQFTTGPKSGPSRPSFQWSC